MNIFTFLHTKAHIISLTTAGLVHVAAFAYLISDSDPIIIQPQTIKVSFVAPSTYETLDSSNEKFEIVKKENTQNKISSKKVNKAKKSNINKVKKLTSGVVKKDSLLKNSADSEPVFNAKYLDNPTPNYPALAKRRRMQGKVLLMVEVDETGNPSAVNISESSGFKVLDQEALRTVKGWRFIPAKKNGKFVQANVIVPIEFKLI